MHYCTMYMTPVSQICDLMNPFKISLPMEDVFTFKRIFYMIAPLLAISDSTV